jgi:hypothetical protein
MQLRDFLTDKKKIEATLKIAETNSDDTLINTLISDHPILGRPFVGITQ